MPDIDIWTNAQYYTMSKSAINILMVLHSMNGQEYDKDFREKADEMHRILQGKGARTSDKLSKLETYITAFEEQGWTERIEEGGKKIFRLTPAGEQAHTLLTLVPDYLKFLPYFILEIISRYQQYNPSREGVKRYLEKGDIFPYRALYRMMRGCENRISEDEFRRFLVRTTNLDQIQENIDRIKNYRQDLEDGVTKAVIDAKYGSAIEGTPARPLYFMHRAGQGYEKISKFGKGIILKNGKCLLGSDIYVINNEYLPFIDYMLNNPPKNQPKDIDANQWFAHYGAEVSQYDEDTLPDDDPVWGDVKELLDNGALGIMFYGPPGTSKTWYANKIAIKIVGGETSCIKNIQFHQSYSYEDFMEGYTPDENSPTGFSIKKKIFLETCIEAIANPHKKYVIIIDEFSRGDPSRIFGEILTYIEYRNKYFKPIYSNEEIYIPDNIIILGTYNPYDKSVADIDVMLERRFERYNMRPNTEILLKILIEQGMENTIIGKVVEFFNKIQKHYELGQAYFIKVKDEAGLRRLWKYGLEPLFQKEYKYEKEKFEDIKKLYPWS